MKKGLLILIALVMTNVAFGQDVQSVLDRYYGAAGITDVDEFKTQAWKIDIEFDMVFFQIGIKLYYKSEQTYRGDLSVMGENIGCMVVDNGVGWVAQKGVPIKKVTDKKELAKGAMMDEIFGILTLNVDKYDITYLGKEGDVEFLEFKDKSGTEKNGEVTKYGFNVKTGLIDYSDYQMDIEGVNIGCRNHYKNYKKFGKYTLPTLVGSDQAGAGIGIKLNDFEVGCTFDDAIFEKPKK